MLSSNNIQANDHSQIVEEPEKTKVVANDSPKEDPNDNTTNLTDKDAVINKLKVQNDKLRNQLKELSYKLTETLDRVKLNKAGVNRNSIQEFRDETVRKELDNAQKQIVSYQKEIEKLKYRLQTTHTTERLSQLENLTKEKDRVIEEMTTEKRNLEKIKRDQEKQLESFKNERDYSTRLNMYAEEVKGLKEKIRELQKQQKHDEKGSKKQQEYLVNLEQRYREICEKFGVSPSLNFSRAEEHNERKQQNRIPNMSMVKDSKKPNPTSTKPKASNANAEDEETNEDEKIELTEEKFKEMSRIIKILKNSRVSTERKYKGEIDQLNSKIKDLEFDNKEVAAKLRDKEKELNISNYKNAEMKRMVKHNQLSPIEKPDAIKGLEANKSPNVSRSMDVGHFFDNKKKAEANKASAQATLLGRDQEGGKIQEVKEHAQDQRRQTPSSKPKESNRKADTKSALKREVKGRYDSTLTEFSDKQAKDQGTKISKLTFWYNDNEICGFKAFYTLDNGNDVAGDEHLHVKDKNSLKSSAIEVDTDDHIAHITGKYKQFVEYIKIVTAKGSIHEFGNLRENGSEDFTFDLETDEHPVSIFGALEKSTTGDGEDSALAYVGFMVGKWTDDGIHEDI